MQLRADQMAAWDAAAQARLVPGIVRHLRAYHWFAVEPWSDVDLEALVGHRVLRARSWGLTWVSSITYFVALSFEMRNDFDAHPSVVAALEEPDLPADHRIWGLTTALTDEDWHELQRD